MGRAASTVVLAALLAGGAAVGYWYLRERPLPIAQIQERATELDGQEVRVRGTVKTAFDILGHGVYSLADDSGEIFVTTGAGAPAAGEQVTVRGRVRKALQVQDMTVVGLREIEKIR